jgi:hypothetical protein
MFSPPVTATDADPERIPTLHGWAWLAILLIAVVAPLWHLHIINRDMPSSHADLVPVLVGARDALNGRDPYSDQATHEIQIAYYGRSLNSEDHVNKMGFAYPAHTAIVLAPLAFLSWDRVRLGFLVLVPILMAASVPLWLRVLDIRMKSSHLAITTVIFLVSWPMMWALRLQQPTLIVAAFLAAGCFLLKIGWDGSAGILLALATIKPQLVGPLIAWLILWALVHRCWRFLGSFTISLALLLIGANAITPDWFAHWHKAGVDLLHYTHQQPVLQATFGQWIGMTLMVAIAAAISSILWGFRRCDRNASEFGIAIGLALAATVSLLPTDSPMIYNNVLLFPALLILIYTNPGEYYPALARRIALALVLWNFLSIPIAVLGETFLTPSDFWEGLPFRSMLLPISVLVALAYPLLQSKVATARAAIRQPQPA